MVCKSRNNSLTHKAKAANTKQQKTLKKKKKKKKEGGRNGTDSCREAWKTSTNPHTGFISVSLQSVATLRKPVITALFPLFWFFVFGGVWGWGALMEKCLIYFTHARFYVTPFRPVFFPCSLTCWLQHLIHYRSTHTHSGFCTHTWT